MLSCLSLDQHRLDHVSMFSKGLLVALTQTLPWCSVSQWTRLLRVLRVLISSSRLHVPFSLEYVDFLPLLDLRRFSCELRLSVLLLRVLQLLCGSSCSHWLSVDGWAHVGRLYAHAVREVMNSVRAKLPLPSSGALTISDSTPPKAPASRDSNPSCTSVKSPKMSEDFKQAEVSQMEEKVQTVPCQEVLFVLSQLFCHVQHVQVWIKINNVATENYGFWLAVRWKLTLRCPYNKMRHLWCRCLPCSLILTFVKNCKKKKKGSVRDSSPIV